MSLKAFHLVFVSVCVAFCLGMAVWWGWQWQAGDAMGGGWYGLGWLVAGAGLVEYGRRVLRKMRNISYL